ncbi:hypothetical protein GPECTOR_33g593 [Gonium pectorale]|uniref:Uncharacterized protein n=1 Tax=Gonium pectorale TaxID=33097 RepID=A0A150GCY0_GONPE|nr:hypothetical protein GPECTOR_33g593 [Gonium pectorale]|eukprot:KXZ47711.1 hypothetical protein GPECTOR_33g593 [Gonium pectorale]
MGNFTSKYSKKSKGPDITEVDRAILSLKTQRKKLEDQEKLINVRLERHAEVARQLAAEGRRDRALLALRKKKLSEKQLAQLHGLILNVEEMLSNIEITKKQTTVFSALQQSNDALKQLQAQVKLEDVQRLLDDTAEAKQYQEELAALLGQQLTATDDEEVEAELAALEEVVQDEEKLAMPVAPTTKVPEVEAAAAARAAQQQAAAGKQSAGGAAADAEHEEEEEEAGAARPEALLAS